MGEALVDRLRHVRGDWGRRVEARSDSAVWPIADLLLRQPVVTAKLVMTDLDVSAPTAQAALSRLVERRHPRGVDRVEAQSRLPVT